MKHIWLGVLVSVALVAFVPTTDHGVGAVAVRYPRSMPKHMKRMRGVPTKFQDHGLHHSAYLSLGDSGRFVYWSTYEVGFDISIGRFSASRDTMTFWWDSLATHHAVLDTSFYRPLFAFSRPKPFKIDMVKYVMKANSLVLVGE